MAFKQKQREEQRKLQEAKAAASKKGPMGMYKSTVVGHFLPFSRGRFSVPFPIENSTFFSDTMSVFPN